VSQLWTIVSSPDPAVRNRSLDAFCKQAAGEELAAEAQELDQLRHSIPNLYERVRTLFFLYAIYRFYMPGKAAAASDAAKIPFDGYEKLLDRRYEEADPGEALGALRARRTESLRWLASLDPQALRATSRLPQGGALGGLDLLAAWVCHDRLHLAQLGATLARQWATAWPSLRVGYAGPIPYEPTGRT